MAELEAQAASEPDEARLATLQRDLRYWRTRLATAEVPGRPAEFEVGFGSRASFRLKGELRVIEIVGDDEADPRNGRIAFTAPLARALTGAGVGDYVDFGGVSEAIKVVEIAALEWD